MLQRKRVFNNGGVGVADDGGAGLLPDIETRSFSLAQRHRELLFILSFAAAVFLLFAFLTYAQSDPGWSHSSTVHQVNNAEGLVGAWVADFGFYTFGYIAYLIPVLLMYLSASLLWFWYQLEESAGFLSRFIGLVFMVISITALTSLYVDSGQALPASAGGMLGEMVVAALLNAFKPFGSTLLLGTLGLTGLSLLMSISWVRVVDGLGLLVIKCFRLIGRGVSVFGRFGRRSDGSEDALSAILHTEQKRTIQRQSKASIKSGSAHASQMPETADKPKLHQRILPKFGEERAKARAQAKLAKSAALPIAKGGRQGQEAISPVDKPSVKRKPARFMPSLNLLNSATSDEKLGYTDAELEEMSRNVEVKLADFNVKANVVAVYPGPVITRFELQLAAGTKASKITGLARDLARSLSMVSVRVVEVIAGKSVVGLELPNRDREIVRLREVLATPVYADSASPLTLVLGKDIAGHPVVADLAKMPHLLVAGTTGSGKSVGLNTMLLSLLYKSKPDALRLILIDPKMLELAVYEGIPHLLAPVVTDMKQAANALRWCVAEMERRYRLMATVGVRNLVGYNKKIKTADAVGKPIPDPLWQANPVLGDALDGEGQPMLEALPHIVVLIDEFADMMMVVGKKVEQLIARIAQKARAAGIHLILATQRPSVDVITGLIKANVPGRIAFQVSSRIDSRTILDQQGAEQLLGHGDMLYLPPGTGLPVRVHGAFVEDEEVHAVVKELAAQGGPDYVEGVLEAQHSTCGGAGLEEDGEPGDSEQDPFYDQAVELVTQSRRASISSVQRRFKIGYNRAARMIEAMEAAGVVSQMDQSGGREVLAPPPREG